MTYSFIIPAYNESSRIRPTLDEILRYTAEQNWDAETLVVDDGSRDDTPDVVREYARVHSQIRLLQNPGNRGKGFSVRNGMLHARGDLCLFTDADLSAPIREAGLLFSAIRSGADIAIGSRWMDRKRQTHRQPWYRQFFGRCFNLVTRTVMGLKFHDTQCGFKAFTRSAAQTVFQLQMIEGWGFDPEILFIASKRHLRVEEVPVTWGHDERSQLSYLKDGFHMLREMALIRWNALVGRYDGAIQPVQRPTA